MSNKIEYISSGPPMMKAPQMTQGGLQRIQLHNRPEISETQHTLTYDDDADSVRRTPIRLVFAKNMSSFALELMQLYSITSGLDRFNTFCFLKLK